MSEEQDKPADDQQTADDPRGGERLAQARRERHISVLEVAKELHLDEPKVRALERNDFDALGAPVFAKGHLRKYAQLVGVDEADVFADYYAMTRATPMPPLIVSRQRIRQEFSPGPWIATVVVLIVAAGAYWWFVGRADTVSPPAPAGELQFEESEPAGPQPEQLSPEQLQPEELISEVDAGDPPIQVASLLPEARALPEAQALPAGQISLTMQFSGECWTEITDADGRRLFFNMAHSGQSAEVSGTAPFTALFGNADNVEVQVNGSSYALPEPGSANRTVRVAINSP
jgi:cytoskeleton protein RodZ